MENLDILGGAIGIALLFMLGFLWLMLIFAPLGCWSRLSKIDKRSDFIHENSFEVRENTRQIMLIQKEILAELKKANDKPSG